MNTHEIEIKFNTCFQKIFSKRVHLHKKINDEDILVLPSYNYVCIIDRNDIQLDDMYLYLHNMPKTQYTDSLIRVSPNDHGHSSVYPYVNFRDVSNDPLSLISQSKFRGNGYVKSTMLLKLRKQDNTNDYYMEYWMNNDIINNLLQNVHERAFGHKGHLFSEIVSSYSQTKLIHKLENELLDLMAPYSFQIENECEDRAVESDPLLKDSVELFDYQISDLNWMRDIEYSIEKGKNTFTHTFPLSYPVHNDSFVFYNSTLYPAHLINQNALSKTSNITYLGGNLISEIGLGKTIVSLYHILSHVQRSRALYDNFVSFGNTCNYAYKRGNMKGHTCKKQCVQGVLYCSEHKKSIFIEKRELIYKNLEQFKSKDFILNNFIKTNATLVICPNQLCDQWVKEYYNKFVNNFRVVMVVTKDQYTNLKLSDILFADIIVVSYQFLNTEYYHQQNIVKGRIDCSKEFCFGPDHKYKNAKDLLDSKGMNIFKLFHWRMLFLDEAHEIQNMKKTNILQHTILQLQSTSKWNITGTPFANGLNGFINLINYTSTFNGSCKSLHDSVRCGVNSNLIQLYKKLFRRNTKQSVQNEYSGTIIEEHMHTLEFTQQEQSIYDSYIAGGKSAYIDLLIKICCHPELYEDTKQLIKNCKTLQEIQEVMLDYNKNQLQSLRTTLQTLENEMRQIQTNISNMGENVYNELDVKTLKGQLATIKRKHTTTKAQFVTVERTYNYLINSIQSIENTEETCPICLDIIETDEKTITKCGHKFCWSCINETHMMKTNTATFSCPTCNSPITNKEIFLYKQSSQQIYAASDLEQIIQKVKSTKIGNIIHYLKNKVTVDDKIILFSQWDELLHKVGKLLQEQNLKIVYCNGTIFQRKRAIQNFTNQSNDVNIILLSSRNAASGINLTAANKIIFLEPVYGSGEYRTNIESQAIGRADRIGQNRPIEVHRFIIKNTIEEDIVKGNIDDDEIRQLRM